MEIDKDTLVSYVIEIYNFGWVEHDVASTEDEAMALLKKCHDRAPLCRYRVVYTLQRVIKTLS